MAYDRYDTRRGQNPDYDRNRREDRGFFERAGDEIASWFGDDDAERRRREDEQMNRGRGPDRNREHERTSGRNQDRDRGFYPEHGYLRSEYEPDYEERGGYRPANWASSDRDYRRGWRGTGVASGYDSGYDYGDRGSGNENWGTGWRYGSNGPSAYRGDYGRGSIGSAGEGTRYSSGRDREFERGSDRRDEFRQASYTGSERNHDRHYHAWRQRHLDELDRDYDDYRRENQARFENDFGSWRENRMQKRALLSQIREHTEVVGSDGEHIGTVDCVRGDRVVLTKSDSPDDLHHSIPCTMLDRVEGDKVILDVKAEEAKNRWREEGRDRALFERERQGDAGPHNLDRSFAGTYEKR